MPQCRVAHIHRGAGRGDGGIKSPNVQVGKSQWSRRDPREASASESPRDLVISSGPLNPLIWPSSAVLITPSQDVLGLASTPVHSPRRWPKFPVDQYHLFPSLEPFFSCFCFRRRASVFDKIQIRLLCTDIFEARKTSGSKKLETGASRQSCVLTCAYMQRFFRFVCGTTAASAWRTCGAEDPFHSRPRREKEK